ncbi:MULTISPECIES: hypothetical protein [unclassified Streptomyces]|uniref:hypothetical protein n=1 Tax=unclassified Streptomyces TaxID=2593676 RepID=UPI0033BB7E93
MTLFAVDAGDVDVGGTAMKGAMVGPVGPTAEAGRVDGGAGSVVDQAGRPGA